MRTNTMTIDEVKTKTRELLGLSEEDDLSYITEDYLNEDFQEIPTNNVDNIPRVVYGYKIAYGHRQGVGATYEFKGGSVNWAETETDACGSGNWWLSQSLWNHDNTDTYCSGSAQPAYRRVARFTYNR